VKYDKKRIDDPHRDKRPIEDLSEIQKRRTDDPHRDKRPIEDLCENR
jgi:hypothetical protein